MGSNRVRGKERERENTFFHRAVSSFEVDNYQVTYYYYYDDTTTTTTTTTNVAVAACYYHSGGCALYFPLLMIETPLI
jgi:hypothetical protein